MLYRRSLISSLKTSSSRNILGNYVSIIPIFKRSLKTTAFNNTPILLFNRTTLITANKQLLHLNQTRYNSSKSNNGDELPKHYNSDGQRELSKEECVELLKSLKQIWSSEEFENGSIVDFDTDIIQSKYRQLFQKYEMQGMNSVSFGNMMNAILTDEDTTIKPGDKVKNVQLFHKAVMEYHLYRQENQENETKQETTQFMSSNSNQNTNKNESSQQSNKNTGGSKNNLQPPPLRLDVLLLWLSSGLLVYLLFSIESNEREITWQDCCTSLLDKGYVEKLIVVNNNVVKVIMNDYGKNQPVHSSKVEYYFTIGSVLKFEENLKHYQEEKNIPDDRKVPVIYVQSISVLKSLYSILPTLLLFGFIFYAGRNMLKSTGGMGGGGLFGPPSSKIIKKFNSESQVNIKFADVAGCDEAKEEVMEFVKFLKNPKKYEKLGAKIPRGAILSGPPGTGKTLLAKATAGEADVPFYSVSGSEFVEMFVGVGASRVRELFKVARENAPSIIFVDEIDAIGKSRSKGRGAGSNDERENTLNQLLVEMDGFSTKDHVVVLAGTNRADVLDSALTRPGRFDRKIYLDNPELEGRKDIFNVHLKKIKLAEECDLEDLKGRLATLTPGFSGADIANVCNEAALIAARHNKEAVSLTDFEQAIERVVAGLEKKSKLLSFQEKKVVAYHEAGHAICGWFLEFADPLLKVSIIPRGQGALGYAQYLPPDIYLYSTKKLLDRMTMTLGGRVSEELHFDSVTSGGSDDFEKVTNLAQRMVLECGMSPKVGLVNYNMDRGNDMTKPFSDKTSSLIDSEIHRLVAECYERCKNLLIEKKDELELVAQELLSKEVITREDMIRLLGKRPFPNRNDAFDLYLADHAERSLKKKAEGNEEENDTEKKKDEGDVKKDE